MRYRQEIVAERLTGQRADPDGFMTHDMKMGVIQEPAAINLYQLRTGNVVDEAPFVPHPDEKIMAGTSPDGFVGDDGCIEVKCLRSANHLYNVMATGVVPDEYRDQIDMHMWITGRKWCDFIAFDSRLPKGLEIFVTRVERDDERMARIEAGVKGFLKECDNDFKAFWAQVKG